MNATGLACFCIITVAGQCWDLTKLRNQHKMLLNFTNEIVALAVTSYVLMKTESKDLT